MLGIRSAKRFKKIFNTIEFMFSISESIFDNFLHTGHENKFFWDERLASMN